MLDCSLLFVYNCSVQCLIGNVELGECWAAFIMEQPSFLKIYIMESVLSIAYQYIMENVLQLFKRKHIMENVLQLFSLVIFSNLFANLIYHCYMVVASSWLIAWSNILLSYGSGCPLAYCMVKYIIVINGSDFPLAYCMVKYIWQWLQICYRAVTSMNMLLKYVDGKVGGWTEAYKHLVYATVRGEAHMVPYAQLEKALILFQRFLSGKPLPQRLSNYMHQILRSVNGRYYWCSPKFNVWFLLL